MKKLLFIFLFIPSILFAQSTGSFWKVDSLGARFGRELYPNTLLRVNNLPGWWKLSDTVSRTMTLQQAIDSGWVTLEATGSIDTSLYEKIVKDYSDTNSVIVFSGDSETAGICDETLYPYPDQVVTVNPFTYKFNTAIGGRTLIEIKADAQTLEDTAYNYGARQNVYVLWAGTNDLYWNDDILKAFKDLESICRERHKKGWQVLVLTMMSRWGLQHDGTDIEILRYQFNALVRSRWASFADGLVDVAADSIYGSYGACIKGSQAWCVDGLHLSDSGYREIARKVSAGINALDAGSRASVWEQSGDDIYYNDGNVGIGTTTPGDKLEVNGNVFAKAFNSWSSLSRYSRNGGIAMAGCEYLSYGYLTAYSNSNGKGKTLALQKDSGSVVIGGIAANADLEVDGKKTNLMLYNKNLGYDGKGGGYKQLRMSNSNATPAEIYAGSVSSSGTYLGFNIYHDDIGTYKSPYLTSGALIRFKDGKLDLCNNSGIMPTVAFTPTPALSIIAGGYLKVGKLYVKSGRADSVMRPDYANGHGGIWAMQALPASQDSAYNPWKFSGGNTIQRGTGNVGIGTTAPGYGLTVAANGIGITSGNLDLSAGGVSISRSSSTNPSIKVIQQSSADIAQFWAASTQQAVIKSTGLVGIRTTAPTNVLDVNGYTRLRNKVWVGDSTGTYSYVNPGDASFTTSSSREWKRNITDIPKPDSLFDKVLFTNPKTYQFKPSMYAHDIPKPADSTMTDEEINARWQELKAADSIAAEIQASKIYKGFIAEDINQRFLGTDSKELNYTDILITLWQATQQLILQNQNLDSRMRTVEYRLNELEKR